MFNILATISKTDMDKIIAPVLEVVGIVIPALLAVVASVGGIYCIILGVKYSKAEDPQEHEKAKNALKNAIIGFVLIFILLAMLKIGYDVFKNYYDATVAQWFILI